MANAIFIAFGLFFLKHFVVDFLLQPPWMYRNKHSFGHPGGLAHALLHAVVTYFILSTLAARTDIGPNTLPQMAVWLSAIEFVLHYMIDWGKMNLSRILRLGPTTHESFWFLLGLDQLLHYLTYLYILLMWFR